MSNETTNEITAEGKQITLANGNEITLRYSFAALSVIETEYGSAKKFAELLSNPEGATMTTLGFGLWAGSQRKMPLEAFMDLLDISQIKQYTEAFANSFQESMGSIGGSQGETEPEVAG